MVFPGYLAQTPEEFTNSSEFSGGRAWMGCGFSPENGDLCSLPAQLPPGSLLILDDFILPETVCAEKIRSELSRFAENSGCGGVVLDFQRPEEPVLQELAQVLSAGLPCPAAVSDRYAKNLSCPVFLSPIPLHIPPEQALAPWQGREIWLDVPNREEVLNVRSDGCRVSFREARTRDGGFSAPELFCHYESAAEDDEIRFSFYRREADLQAYLDALSGYGVTKTLGLWQEFLP